MASNGKKRSSDDKPLKEQGDWLFLIPVQVGPASPYARNMKSWMHFIVIIQAVVCACRLAILYDFTGALWMSLVISLCYYAILQEMNITYVCCWGLLCGVNGVFDVLAIILPSIMGLLKFNFLSTFVRVCVPVVYLAGALFAWHLYLDHEHHKGHHVGKLDKFDPMARYADSFDCAERTPLQAARVCAGHVFASDKTVERMKKEHKAAAAKEVEVARSPPELEAGQAPTNEIPESTGRAEQAEVNEPPSFPQPCC